MANSTQKRIRRIPLEAADFDEQLWPINLAVFVLGGVAAGIVVATTENFHDPVLLRNGWFRLTVVGLLVSAMLWAVRWLQGRVRRRVLFCLLVSLLVHLGVAVVLHDKYIALKRLEKERQEEAIRLVQQIQRRVTPDYFWERVERPEAEQAFERPLESLTAEPPAPEVQREPPSAEPLVEKPQRVEPPLEESRPEPLRLQRAELSAPRRADAAGRRISRQPWTHRLVPGEPIPQPEVQLEGRPARAELRPQLTVVTRGEAPEPAFQPEMFLEPADRRRVEPLRIARRAPESEPPPDVPTTPAPMREPVRPAELPRIDEALPELPTVAQAQPAELDARPTLAPRRDQLPRPSRAVEPT
ncbi:MAG TPA: hypothetical protein EYP56_12655, partial [Planctomycetaceae bacterium]|nr:hypothetical protein [Planctomycetaceae bacterium]